MTDLPTPIDLPGPDWVALLLTGIAVVAVSLAPTALYLAWWH